MIYPDAIQDETIEDEDEDYEPEPVKPKPRSRAKKTVVATDKSGGIARDKMILEAREYGDGQYGVLMWLDQFQVKNQKPAISDWWKSALKAFYDSGKTWLLVNAGRGAGKSSSLVRMACAETIIPFYPRLIPGGDIWIWPFVSVRTDETKYRILDAKYILKNMGLEVKSKQHGGGKMIETKDIDGNDVAMLSMTGTIGALSGPSALGCTLDEESKLLDKEHHVNPASELVATADQMFRRRPHVHGVRCSSPMKTEGSHFESIKEGSNIANHVATLGEFAKVAIDGLIEVAQWEEQKGRAHVAKKIRDYAATVNADCKNIPTWVGNPTISAIDSREGVETVPDQKLRDEGLSRADLWLRENAAVPMVSGGMNWSAADWAELARMNASIGQRREPGLTQFDGLADGDPRSRSNKTRERFSF